MLQPAATALLLCAVFQMCWCLDHVAQGALQRSRAVNDHSHPEPGNAGAAGTHMGTFYSSVWPTCDDVLNGAILALVHGPVVFGLPPAQFCNQLVLLLPLLLGLDLDQQRGYLYCSLCFLAHRYGFI